MEGKQHANIGTHRKKITIFFSDIVGFTSLTESMASEDLTYLLNSYLSRMAEIVLKHGGTLDKFIGDAIMVFFGDPQSKGIQQDALACLSMALEMKTVLKELQNQWFKGGIGQPLRVRMGIATGFSTVGNFGCDQKMDYTVIGEPVNLASRLETSAQPDQILVSQETWTLIQDEVHCIPHPPLLIKGVDRPITTYQVMDFFSHTKEARRMAESCQGFSMQLDPEVIPKDDVSFVLEKLKMALSHLKSFES